jgi:hypothetical protein
MSLSLSFFTTPYVAGPLSKPVYFSEEAGCFSTPSNPSFILAVITSKLV